MFNVNPLFNYLVKIYKIRILLLIITLTIIGCSSGAKSPITPPTDDNQIGSKIWGKEYSTIPFELDILNSNREASSTGIGLIVENLKYDINAGWAKFDLRLSNSGATIFDSFLTIEQINPSGQMSVDGTISQKLKYGIIVRGIPSVTRHIELTFQPGVAPKLTGFMEISHDPLFQNENTILHTDKFADHAHDYSFMSGRIIADQVLVRFRENINLSQQYEILDSRRLIPVGVNLSNRFIQTDILDDMHPDDKVDELMGDYRIDHAEVNTINFIQYYPDDPIFNPNSGAWEGGYNSWGQRRIQADDLWDFYNDKTLDQIGDVDTAYDTNAKIIMFICDTGYRYHEDLAIDSEDEEFINMGLNIVSPGDFPTDNHGHATLISGIAMGEGNNQKGMAGMAWNARIIPLKTNADDGQGDEFRSGIAISYAKEKALEYPEYRCVGNMSYGTHSQQPDIDRVNEESAFEDAWPVENLQFVAAAGNCANNPSTDPSHPCYYNFKLSADNHYPCAFKQVINVAASKSSRIDGKDEAAGFSNYGYTVDVSAPGVDIYSCWKDSPSSYKRVSGTSCSSPFVAGLFALIWSRNPSLTKVEIRQMIRNTTDPMYLYPSRIGKMGTGRINAFKAFFAAELLKPPVGEKIRSGDIDGDLLDETCLGLNGHLRNTGMLLVFDSFGREMTNQKLKFGVNELITDTVFADLDWDNKDEIVVSLVLAPGGLFEIDWPSNVVSIRKIDYSYGEFTVTPLYAFFEEGTTTEHIAAGDFDNDGADEIAVALQTAPSGYFSIGTPTNTLSIEIIDQNGTLLRSIPVGDDMLATALITADIDDDQMDEIILAYIENPAGIFAIDGGTNTGKLLILDDHLQDYAEITNNYIPQNDRVIEQVLCVNLDDDIYDEIVIAAVDYPGGYLENTSQPQNHVVLFAFDDINNGMTQLATKEFNDNRRTFQLTEGNIHPADDDRFWAWFTIDRIGVDYISGSPGGSLLMVPYGIEEGEFVQRGESASSGNGYSHFSGCVRNGDMDYTEPERNETALYAIEGGRYFGTRYFEYHDDTGSNLYITWEYDFPKYLKHFEYYKENIGDDFLNPGELPEP